MGLTDLNRVRYAGLDFDTELDELRARLQVKFAADFNDFSVSSQALVLLDSVSFGLDTLSFYIDRRATDTYLQTARTRRSVALLTRQLGYKMTGAVASSTDLTVAASQLYAFPLPIPKGFRFQGPGAAVFEAAQAVTIPASSLASVSIPIYQGQTVTENFVSDGTADQIFRLSKVPSGTSIVQGTVGVLVNGSPFSESEFITFDATDQFELGYNDSPPTLRFGDGVAGNIPVKAGSIVITYVASLGAAGQSLSGTIVKEVNPLVVMAQPISLTITNQQSTVGGSDLEDLDHAKTYAPKVFKSRRVAVTQTDYEALAGSFVDPLFGRVAVAQAISARSATSDLELQNLLSAIRNANFAAVNSITAALNTSTTGAFARAGVLFPAIAALQADQTTLLTRLNTVSTNLTSVQSAARSIKSDSGESAADYGDAHTEILVAKTHVTALRGDIVALPTASPSQLTAGDHTTFLALIDGFTESFNKVDALLGLISALVSSISASADSQTTVMNIVQGSLSTDIGLSVGTNGTIVKDVDVQLTAAAPAVGVNTVPYTGLYQQLHAISDAANLNSTTISTDLDSIEDHVDKFLAADCQANLVVVPILSRDAAGFYAGPSNGLIRALQAYLDGIKDITHTVKVTSGSNYLVPAAISIRIGVRTGISTSVTSASATTVVDGALRDRSFGLSLYISDLDTPLKALPGVAFVNVEILGYRPVGSGSIFTDFNDPNGNLVIDSSRVITLSVSDLSVQVEVVS